MGTNVTGALNVSRVAGRKGFIVTFLGDALKGVIVVLLCRYLKISDIITLLCIFLVIAGHIFPFQLKFKGGKGMSTMLGAFLTYDPLFIILAIITFAVLFPFVRKYTITSLFALLLLPLEMQLTGYAWYQVLLILMSVVIIAVACRSNLKEYYQSKNNVRK